MTRSTETWCWQCGDPVNCGVDRYSPGAHCPYGPGKAAGLRIKADKEAAEVRLREIVREELRNQKVAVDTPPEAA